MICFPPSSLRLPPAPRRRPPKSQSNQIAKLCTFPPAAVLTHSSACYCCYSLPPRRCCYSHCYTHHLLGLRPPFPTAHFSADPSHFPQLSSRCLDCLHGSCRSTQSDLHIHSIGHNFPGGLLSHGWITRKARLYHHNTQHTHSHPHWHAPSQPSNLVTLASHPRAGPLPMPS